MLRFASSPTGDMYTDDLRSALFNYILSKQRDENLVIRIDDTDNKQNIEAKDQEILDLLDLFKIEYSQVLYQSKNFRFYSAMALQLLHEKKAFSCFCSDAWLLKKKDEASQRGEEYYYDDACRDLPAELVIDNTAPFSIRIVRPKEDIDINDIIQGELCFKANKIDSFVILNRDKTPTANFACAVDDMLNDISLVIRNEKYIEDTPKQVHIRNSLHYDKKIEYAHLPVLENNKSVKLLLEEGFLPEAISNYLISIGYENLPAKIFTLQEAIEWFDLSKISKDPAPFDLDVLKDINREHLRRLDSKELSRYVGFADEDIGRLASLYLEEVGTTKELKTKISSVFSSRDISDENMDTLRSIIKTAPYFDEYDDLKSYLTKNSTLDEKEIVQSFRLLLTGSADGPDIAQIYKYLKNYLGEIVK